jgi:hypothetical protein
MIVQATLDKPPREKQGFELECWVEGLIDLLGMKLAAGPIACYVTDPGNVGWTVAACIKTSHLAFHFWSEEYPARVQADVYSCAPIDPKVVVTALTHWGLIEGSWWLYDRENEPRLEKHGAVGSV